MKHTSGKGVYVIVTIKYHKSLHIHHLHNIRGVDCNDTTHQGDSYVILGEGSGPREASTEMESWEEPELMQFSVEFSPRAMKRVKRDDGLDIDSLCVHKHNFSCFTWP